MRANDSYKTERAEFLNLLDNFERSTEPKTRKNLSLSRRDGIIDRYTESTFNTEKKLDTPVAPNPGLPDFDWSKSNCLVVALG